MRPDNIALAFHLADIVAGTFPFRSKVKKRNSSAKLLITVVITFSPQKLRRIEILPSAQTTDVS